MKLTDIRRIGWDTETTGASPTTDRIVTAAIIVRDHERGNQTLSWVINPGVDVPTEVSDIHGYTTARVQAEGVEPAGALNEIANRLTEAITLRLPLIAFNTSFDWTVLHHDLIRNGLPTMYDRLAGEQPLTLIDPHVIDKQVDRYVKGAGQRKLKPTAERYGIEITDWHEASADAEAALGIAEAQFDIYSSLTTYTPQGLFEAQQQWRAEQQAGLQAYFRRTDPNAFVDPGWPLLAGEVNG
jgi:DNA polymerase-3 subunit epsilon